MNLIIGSYLNNKPDFTEALQELKKSGNSYLPIFDYELEKLEKIDYYNKTPVKLEDLFSLDKKNSKYATLEIKGDVSYIRLPDVSKKSEEKIKLKKLSWNIFDHYNNNRAKVRETVKKIMQFLLDIISDSRPEIISIEINSHTPGLLEILEPIIEKSDELILKNYNFGDSLKVFRNLNLLSVYDIPKLIKDSEIGIKKLKTITCNLDRIPSVEELDICYQIASTENTNLFEKLFEKSPDLWKLKLFVKRVDINDYKSIEKFKKLSTLILSYSDQVDLFLEKFSLKNTNITCLIFEKILKFLISTKIYLIPDCFPDSLKTLEFPEGCIFNSLGEYRDKKVVRFLPPKLEELNISITGGLDTNLGDINLIPDVGILRLYINNAELTIFDKSKKIVIPNSVYFLHLLFDNSVSCYDYSNSIKFGEDSQLMHLEIRMKNSNIDNLNILMKIDKNISVVITDAELIAMLLRIDTIAKIKDNLKIIVK